MLVKSWTYNIYSYNFIYLQSILYILYTKCYKNRIYVYHCIDVYPIQIIVQTGWQICDPLRHEDRLIKVNIPFNILFREGGGFDPMKLSGGRTSGLGTNWFEWSHAPILSKKGTWLCLQCWRQQVLLLLLKVLGWAPHFFYNFLVLMFCYSHINIYIYYRYCKNHNRCLLHM